MKTTKFAKTCSLVFRISLYLYKYLCLYLVLDQQILKILTQIQLDNQGFFYLINLETLKFYKNNQRTIKFQKSISCYPTENYVFLKMYFILES